MYIANIFLDATNDKHKRILDNIRYNIIDMITNKTNNSSVGNKVSEYLDANLILTSHPVGGSDVVRFRYAYVEEVCKSFSSDLKGLYRDFIREDIATDDETFIDLLSEKFLSFSCYILPGAYRSIESIYAGDDLHTAIDNIPNGLIINREIYGSDFINSDEANWRLYSILYRLKSPFANMEYINRVIGNRDRSRPMEDAYSEHKRAIARICDDNPYTSKAIVKMKANYDKLGYKSLSEDELSSIACEWAETAIALALLDSTSLEETKS